MHTRLLVNICALAAFIDVIACHGHRPGSRDTHHGYGPPSYPGGYPRRPDHHPAQPNGDHHHYYYGVVHKYIGERGHGSHPEQDNNKQHRRNRPLSHDLNEDKAEEECNCESPEKQWTFMVGDNYGPWEYIDFNGYIRGFHIDLIHAVCEKAGKKCYHILDSYQNCWNTEGPVEMPGKGLMDGWYDGCVGLQRSPERQNSFNFSVPFAPNSKASLHYLKDSLPENPKNLTSVKIGFIDGWAVGKKCLGRQFGYEGNTPVRYEPVLFDSHENLILALQMREVDAILTSDFFDTSKLKLLGMVAIEPWFECTTSGSSMMARYDSEAIGWWNEAFLQMVETGEFNELCYKGVKKHGHRGKITCELE